MGQKIKMQKETLYEINIDAQCLINKAVNEVKTLS